MSEKDLKLGGAITVTEITSISEQLQDESNKAHRNPIQRFIDGFKPLPSQFDNVDPNMSEVEKANYISTKTPLKKKLKSRHLQMISIGGAIGTGLFVGSGGALRNGGPAAVLIAWILVGAMMFCTVHSLGELCVAFPVSGSYAQYNTRFISPAWGFAMCWNSAMGSFITLPLELVAASMTIKYWGVDVSPAVWVTLFWLMIVGINLFGVRGYGEAEYLFSMCKVIAIIGFIFLGIILICGGGPKGGFIGGKYWRDPGAFSHGVKGVCKVFVTAAFSFGGTETCGMAAAETADPRKSLPKATKQVFWRITLFYIVGLTLVGLLVPYNDKQLLGGKGSYDASVSPFVIAIQNGGIKGLPSVMNVVIMISVLSVGNTATYGCSRVLVSLSEQGFAPRSFGYIDREGRPLVGVVLCLVSGLLCYLSVLKNESTVFTWMMSISGLSAFFSWASICASHFRFRLALKANGRSTDELSFTSAVGTYGSYFGFGLICVVLIVEFWVSLFPGSTADAENFFQTWLCVPVIILFLSGYFIWKRKFVWLIPIKDIDIDSGRRVADLDLLRQEVAEERAELVSKPFYYRVYRFWC
ncbi:unnamed protein product [Ambrosiozyma monospora]|uniref:Unnamed protein product n=1 Tax=Ambrosiozyma monospora TaxID=43982 RepID=A0ACB5STY4_AMBMO|nr:unnamed protein product [Ambrosiozyma monospora]